MGIFDTLFGSPAGNYPQDEKSLSEVEIKKLVSRVHIRTLRQGEEGLVEQAIAARRHGDGKISLRQIYEALTQLKNQGKISVYDRKGLMKMFEEYFQ
ncbi:MAG: hypothetical protein A3C90_00850 [Candidatus Magasanikbacteria bacterium RIFCSPHIGHO2_02_FULL_51_14]|uniref:Uncharacterized protein n=1 Tax=Candidatus Magasanikbacteria bacterium RIFCSPHIGHO2_02_FULL_51_14 TaxID=1798683 RepID=A0A1F6ME07_9BACT|nr:MAG: hypothetical protein A3C90_00850 [Candidatus Magasanikbacteria bacterium RIFCSPHIGHO2_02_FULL_51_14]